MKADTHLVTRTDVQMSDGLCNIGYNTPDTPDWFTFLVDIGIYR